MQSEDNAPLLIFGTPLGNWYLLAEAIRKGVGYPKANVYGDWHWALFGANSTELQVGKSRSNEGKLEIPLSFRDEMENLVKDVSANTRWAGVSAYGCWTGDSWLAALPSATGLVFYEHPAQMISRCLSADPSSSVKILLSIWSAAAQKIIDVVRLHRDRVYVFNITECLKSEEKYWEWMDGRLGIRSDAVSAREPLLEDTGLCGLVEILCSQKSSITKLIQELDASAQPIDDGWKSAGSEEIEISSLAALEELLALRRKSSELAMRNRESENSIARLENAVENHKGLLVQKQKENLDTVETLLRELHQSFEESEQYYANWKKAELSRKELSLKVDAVVRGEGKEESEHRHIDYTFQNAILFGRHWPILCLRLVQHLGHAGIAFFASDNSKVPPIESWKPMGTENDVPFWLFVPTDAPSRNVLNQASTRDFVLVADSVSLVLGDLRENGLPEDSRTSWGRVVERLLGEINDLSERLRYDSIHTELKPAEDSKSVFFFEVINASFRGRIFPRLKLNWNPALMGGRLGVNLVDDLCPPLTYWPEGVDGKYVDCLVFEYSTWRIFAGKNRYILDRLTRGDKAFLHAVLSEIPHFLAQASRQHPGSAVVLKYLQKYGEESPENGRKGKHPKKRLGFID